MEIGLADVITSLKRELLEVQKRPEERILTIKDIEIELKFVVEKERGVVGKGHYLFFAAEAKGSYKNQNVHTIKLKLEPNKEFPHGGNIKVGGD
jgi:hypothetical protein